jgi:glycosyltransferase, family 8
MNKEIPVFFAVDNRYIPFLGVALKSLIDNTSKENKYAIKILYTSVTEENKKRIKKYEQENVTIEFVDLNKQLNEIKEKLYTRNYFSNTTYYRLFIPELYPQYDKAVYIDSDTICLADIADLYNVDMEDNLIAGVSDGAVQSIEIFQDYVEKVVGVSDYNNYFNAGVIVMNLKELRKYKFKEKFIYLLEKVRYEVAQDQDYLNRLCKGRVKIIDYAWNRMPIMGNRDGEINIIHYNLGSKPWYFDDILYQEYFWKYAEKTEFYNEIKEIGAKYTDKDKEKDDANSAKLIELAQKEADCVGDDRINKNNPTKKKRILVKMWKNRQGENSESVEKSKYRQEVLKKIEKLEKEGKFDVDAENDPPTIVLTPENVDYLRRKMSSKLKRIFANKVGERFLNNLLKDNKLIIKEIKGIENLSKVSTGAIVTCNHFNPFDCFTIEKVFRMSGKIEEKRLYKVIREGNYTNFPGLYGFFFRNCDTLPLSSNKRTMVEFMKAVDTLLQKGDFILIYPEQSMWWNYRKPKPLKHGAFKMAARNNVPVIPIFITMQDSDKIDGEGFPIQEYTVNIAEPIYPDENLSQRENTEIMLNKNFEAWKKIYEDFYGIPLEYTTEVNEENVNVL